MTENIVIIDGVRVRSEPRKIVIERMHVLLFNNFATEPIRM